MSAEAIRYLTDISDESPLEVIVTMNESRAATPLLINMEDFKHYSYKEQDEIIKAILSKRAKALFYNGTLSDLPGDIRQLKNVQVTDKGLSEAAKVYRGFIGKEKAIHFSKDVHPVLDDVKSLKQNIYFRISLFFFSHPKTWVATCHWIYGNNLLPHTMLSNHPFVKRM